MCFTHQNLIVMNSKVFIVCLLRLMFVPIIDAQPNNLVLGDSSRALIDSVRHIRENICPNCWKDPCVIAIPPFGEGVKDNSYSLIEGLHISDIIRKDSAIKFQFVFSTYIFPRYLGFHFQEVAIEVADSYTLFTYASPGKKSGETIISKFYYENDSSTEEIKAGILFLIENFNNNISISFSGIDCDNIIGNEPSRNNYSVSVYQKGKLNLHYENWWNVKNSRNGNNGRVLENQLVDLIYLADSICDTEHHKLIQAVLE